MNIIEKLKDRIQGKAPKGAKRSSNWSKVRKQVLQDNKKCAICGKKKKLEAHHRIPFFLAPDLELDKDNIIVLCRKHHLLFGHLNFYQSFNSNVDLDVKTWNYKLKNRP